MDWKNEEIIFLKENYKNKGLLFCANKLNRTKHSVAHKATRLNLKVNKKILKQLKSTIVKKYWKINANKTIKNNLLKKLKTDIYNIDGNFAYILGYLWGDGYIHNRGIGNKNLIILEIVLEDGNDIKDKMMSILNWNVIYRKRKNRRNSIRFEINSRLLVEYFCSFDYDKKSIVSPNKILSMISEENKKYFYMGISDADGCFYINKKNYTYQYFISSTYEQDWKYMEDIFLKLDIKYKIIKRKQKRKDGNYQYSSIIRISYKDGILKFGNYLYSGEFIGLKRKYDKYLEILK